MPTDVLGALTQFGTAGLIAWMWLTERRAGAKRERQLDEEHERLSAERRLLESVIGALAENSRVLAQLEAAVRALGGREGRRAG